MSDNPLFTPVTIGALALPNRVVMAPLTRARASEAHVPSPMMARYYAQRASAGLIVAEATAIDPLGMGWYRAPGLWNSEQVAGWQHVTAGVHAAGGRIVAQLWHMGRLVLPDYIGGAQPLGPSAIAGEGSAIAPRPPGDTSRFLPMKPYVVPRPMDEADIAHLIAAYRAGAINAQAAGFDGVEIHGANGYVIDQFLKSRTNVRTDRWGGSLLNRTRLLREIVQVVTEVVTPGRVGLRISPTSERKGMGDDDPGALAAAVGTIVEDAGLAYVHLIEPVTPGFIDMPERPVLDRLRSRYQGAIIQNGGFDMDSAAEVIRSGQADAVSFGRPFIANPDLVRRMREGLPLASADMDYAYIGEEQGYLDYPPAAG
jgi:2,4-dienoyl-CoA reductase-like NADH-dependent reductase (Old Yellow Enzyme family)